MRTCEEIEKDLESAKSAMAAMANIDCHGDSGDNEGKGIFLDNCARRIRALREELAELVRQELAEWAKKDSTVP